MQLTETEIKGLCLKSREIFLSQPILLELEAPLKICGKFIKFFTLPNLIDLSRSVTASFWEIGLVGLVSWVYVLGTVCEYSMLCNPVMKG